MVLGYCEENGRECIRVYYERFPNRRELNHPTLAAIQGSLLRTVHFTSQTVDCGRHRFVRVPETEEDILERVGEIQN